MPRGPPPPSIGPPPSQERLLHYRVGLLYAKPKGRRAMRVSSIIREPSLHSVKMASSIVEQASSPFSQEGLLHCREGLFSTEPRGPPPLSRGPPLLRAKRASFIIERASSTPNQEGLLHDREGLLYSERKGPPPLSRGFLYSEPRGPPPLSRGPPLRPAKWASVIVERASSLSSQ